MSGEGETPSAPLQVKKSGFEWVVKKDSFSRDKVGKWVKSRSFNCGLIQTSLYLEFGLSVPSTCDDISVELYLMPSSIPLGQIHTKFQLGLVTKDGKERNVKNCKYVFTKLVGSGCTNFIKLDSLLAEKNDYFKNDELTIFCNLQKCVEVPKSTFSDDLSEMLESGEFSDATVVVRGEELKVHRCVLSLRSPAFRTAFHQNKLRSGRLVIEDLDVNGVKGLLRFLYSGEIKDLPDIAEFVLPAAAKFGAERLKALCELELCEKINLQNANGLLKLAELHTAEHLKAKALTLMCENSTEVVKDPGFWQLNESSQKQVVFALVEKAETGEPFAKRIKLN